MRIIGGELGGRKIRPPGRMPYTRPTTDIAKESLFNVIENNLEIPALKTCDLFGGTGSISYELMSRGATDCTIVEKDPAMYAFIRSTAAALKLETLRVIRMDVFRFIGQCAEAFDLIFAGPPYALTEIDTIPPAIIEKKMLKPNGWLILEHTPRNDYSHFDLFVTARKYGTTIFSIFVNK